MIPVTGWLTIAGLSLGCALLALLAGVVLLRLLRRRAMLALLLVATVAGLGTVALSVAVTAREMLLSEHDSHVVFVVLLLSAPAGIGVMVLLGRSIRQDSRRLGVAARQVGAGDYVPASGTMSSELSALASELDAAHDRLAESQERERLLESSRRELVAWLSHDLRTPLAGLRAMIEALQDGMAGDDATVTRYHQQMGVEVARLTDMVNDLFEMCRIQGSLRLDVQRVGAHDLVDEALASVDPVARGKGVRLVGLGDEATPCEVPVDVDTDELGRVLRNLLLNAIRHTPADGTVALSVSRGPSGVELAVTDACGGIPAADLPRVFDTAFRGSPARTPATGQGGGLGLAIARGIVEAHQGVIDVSNHAAGCRFVVRLPLAVD